MQHGASDAIKQNLTPKQSHLTDNVELSRLTGYKGMNYLVMVGFASAWGPPSSDLELETHPKLVASSINSDDGFSHILANVEFGY